METGFKALWNSLEFRQFSSLKRWNGLITNQQESVMEHSFVVTILSRLIAQSLFEGDVEKVLLVVTKAMFHDFDEAFSGDIPHHIKHDDEVGSQMRNAIDCFTKRELTKVFSSETEIGVVIQNGAIEHDDGFVNKTVKLADWLSMLMFLEREVKLGNRDMEKHMEYCKVNTISSIDILKKDLEWQVKKYNVNILNDIIKTIL